MKTTLFTLLLLACLPLSAQQIFEATNSSWNDQNHSTETWQTFTITGFTDFNPGTGLIAPAFKITNGLGTPVTSFYVDHSDALYMMDFTIRDAGTPTIILTGMTAVINPVTPYKMWIMEIDLFTGAIIQNSIEYTNSGSSMVPHQVILSPASKQVVVVGTQIFGLLSTSNAFTIPKTGFILAVDEANFNTILYTKQMNTGVTGPTDNDMLENIAEVPGKGYFISGSANNAVNEQNLYTMGIDYAGNVLHSNIFDNTNYHYAGASVMYNAPLNRVYVLANNSVAHTFEVAYFDPNTGVLLSPMYRHVITSLPVGGGIDVNGFKLQQTPSNEIIVGGYIGCWNPAILPAVLTPFEMTLDANLTTMLNGKMFPSRNNSPLAGYYNEMGNSVYINTPDMDTYNHMTGYTHIVNPSTPSALPGGYDINISIPMVPRFPCETPIPTAMNNNTPIKLGSAIHSKLPMYAVSYPALNSPRTISESYLCAPVVVPPVVTATLTLYPNPASGYLEAELDTEIATVSVTDMQGSDVTGKVARTVTRGNVRFDVSSLAPGVYTLLVTDTEGQHYRENFVKE